MSKIEVSNLNFVYLFKCFLTLTMISKNLYQITVDSTNSELILFFAKDYSSFCCYFLYLNDCFNIFNTLSNYLHQAPRRFLIHDKQFLQLILCSTHTQQV